MLRQIKLLARVQLANFFGINEARFSKDAKQRRSRIAMLCLMSLLVILFAVYAGMACYGMVQIGAGKLVPVVLAMVVGLIVLVYSILRSGTVLFDRRSYEMLSALPLKPVTVVISRFVTMYAADAGLSLMLFLPAVIVCGWLQRPGVHFYPMMVLGALLLPLIPLALSMLLGAIIYGVAGRMRHKNAVVVVLSMLMVCAVLAAPMLLSVLEDHFEFLIFDIAGSLGKIVGRVYPPALWFGDAVNQGSWLAFAKFAGVSVGGFLLAACLVGRYFSAICALLHAQNGKREFRLHAQKGRGAYLAMLSRELKHYFSCPVYVMNTLVGGIMAVLMAVAALYFRSELLLAERMLGGIITRFMPVVAAMMFVICPTTSCGISIEGKNLWLMQNLPVRTKAVVDSKLLLNLCVTLPFWLAMEALLNIALPVKGLLMLWLWLVPLVYILFVSVLGLAVNLLVPMLNWENPTQPVKQSKAVAFTMLGGFISLLLPAAGLYFLPASGDAVLTANMVLLLVFGAFLYRWCCGFPLNRIGE